MGNSNTIAPYKLDGFMDNVHSLRLKDLNIRMYIECIELQCHRPNQQSLFVELLFHLFRYNENNNCLEKIRN